LRLSRYLHHVVSMRLTWPENLIRHGYRKSGTPFQLSPRSPLGALQIDTSCGWHKSPSPGRCFMHDHRAFRAGDWCHVGAY